MKLRLAAVPIFLLIFLTPCFAHHMAVIVNKDNNTSDLTAAHLAKIARLEVKKWPDGTGIVLVPHKDFAGETETLELLNN